MKVTLLAERIKEGDTRDGWYWTPGDLSVGIWEGWAHCCDDDVDDAPELHNWASIYKATTGTLTTSVWVERLNCPCGAILFLLDQYTETEREGE